MSTLHKITCDVCGDDLTSTGNSIDWRLALTPERKPCRGGAVTDMMIYPAIKHDMHFCNLVCLDVWTDRRRHKDRLWKASNEAWKETHGTKHDGRIVSYPCRPREEIDTLEAEFSKAAEEAFPAPETRAQRMQRLSRAVGSGSNKDEEPCG